MTGPEEQWQWTVEDGRVYSGNPYEREFGYARAVRAGDFVLVSGCSAYVDGVVHGEMDPFEQTVTAIRTGARALAEFGLGVADVVRTRMYLAHNRDVEAVGRAHQEMFGRVRPASTMVVVTGMVDSRMLLELDMDAYRPATGRTTAH